VLVTGAHGLLGSWLTAALLQRGARVRVRIGATDLLTLDVHASVVARVDGEIARTFDAGAEESADDAADEGAPQAGPLTLAIETEAEPDATAGAMPAVLDDPVAAA